MTYERVSRGSCLKREKERESSLERELSREREICLVRESFLSATTVNYLTFQGCLIRSLDERCAGDVASRCR